jgi:uncharacterized protein Yka (UPF0111/DUF47 family)
MLYERLTNNELERWCYASPKDAQASAEVARRLNAGLRGITQELGEAEDYIKDLEEQIDELTRQVASLGGGV